MVTTTPWVDNTELLIVAKNCLQNQTHVEHIVNYNLKGGKLLSVCSDLIERLNGTVKAMAMDHAKVLAKFCYKGEAMPEFVCDMLKCEYEESVVDDKWSILSSASEEEWPVILSAHGSGTAGPVIVSLIQLFYPPSHSELGSEFKNRLEESEAIRLHILRNLLKVEFELDCGATSVPSLSPCYLVTNSAKARDEFLQFFRELATPNGQLKSKSVTLHLTNSLSSDNKQKTSSFTEHDMPIILEEQCKPFNSALYFNHLRTKSLGRVVLFNEVVTTTMAILERMVEFPEVVAIAKIQTQGKGRGGNAWLSPEGCAMFTFPLKFPLKSQLGQRPSFVQHIAALALVEGVKMLSSIQDIDLHIKWPNDIYIGSSKSKIGGLIVRSAILGDIVVCTIGCGLNVNNSAPTACVNQLLEVYGHSPLSTEQVIGSSLGRMENLVDEFQALGPAAFISRYIDNWMHSGTEVTLPNGRKAQVVGLDDFGYLRVKTSGEGFLSLHPDGNSFDMMHNLIIAKESV